MKFMETVKRKTKDAQSPPYDQVASLHLQKQMQQEVWPRGPSSIHALSQHKKTNVHKSTIPE